MIDLREPPPITSFEINWTKQERESFEGDFEEKLWQATKEQKEKNPRVDFYTVVEGYIDPETGERVGRELLRTERLALIRGE
jgi:hypothetical protein